MPVLVTSKQLSLKKLTEALLTSRASQGQVAEAVEAIRRANPGLVEGRIPKGTPIVVPPLKHERVDVSAVGRRVGSDLDGPLGVVGDLQPFASENRDRVALRVEQMITEVKRLARRAGPIDPNEMSALIGVLEADVQLADELLTSWSDAVPGWQERLLGLQDRVVRARG